MEERYQIYHSLLAGGALLMVQFRMYDKAKMFEGMNGRIETSLLREYRRKALDDLQDVEGGAGE